MGISRFVGKYNKAVTKFDVKYGVFETCNLGDVLIEYVIDRLETFVAIKSQEPYEESVKIVEVIKQEILPSLYRYYDYCDFDDIVQVASEEELNANVKTAFTKLGEILPNLFCWDIQ